MPTEARLARRLVRFFVAYPSRWFSALVLAAELNGGPRPFDCSVSAVVTMLAEMHGLGYLEIRSDGGGAEFDRYRSNGWTAVWRPGAQARFVR